MSELIRVPDLGGEGEVIELLVKVGDRIEADQSVLTLESDKASMEVPSPKAGVIKEIKVKIGDRLKEGDELLVLEVEGAAQAAPAPKAAAAPAEAPQAAAPAAAPAAAATGSSVQDVHVPDIGTDGKVKVIEVMVKAGDTIEADQSLITLESDKASMEIPSPAAGVVEEVLVKLDDEIGTGDLILKLKVAGAAPAAAPAQASQEVHRVPEGAAPEVAAEVRAIASLSAAAADPVVAAQHPDWWLAQLQAAYRDDWQRIVAAGNQPPPMGLRVNVRQATRDDYFARLQGAGIEARAVGECGLALARPVAVDSLPGFAQGVVSVQDPGAQRAAELLAPAPGSRVLDACAAPGGKTAHLLERADLDLLALDLKASRCRRIEENLSRLHLQAEVKVADCVKLDKWWDGRPFAAVLADVPCTASGVVRRNPDAKWLRREADIASFAAAQARILDALWQVVQPGGKLLYATCSVFPAENGQQIERFLARRPQAGRCHEEQLLPTAEHDGFYYCLLEKRA